MLTFKDNLQNTSISTDSEALPHRLLASHLYSPASVLMISVKTNCFPKVRCPSLVLTQDTLGGGVPVASHIMVKSSSSIIFFLVNGLMDEGSEKIAQT